MGARTTPHLRQLLSRGQALAEFTLVVPFLLMLLIGIGDWGRLYTTGLTVESAAREAAMYGGFQGSYWSDSPSNNVPGTIAEMERRACTAAGSLPDYQGASDHSTCTNPKMIVDAPYVDPSGVVTKADALASGLLTNPGGTTDCADPASTEQACRVHVRLQYQFRMLLGGIGIPGLFQFPTTFTLNRDVYFAINDFPQAPGS